jgi:hypothetical protein
MSVQGEIRLTEEWLQAKELIKEHLLALSEALAGRVNEYAPDGQQLKGSFLPSPLFDDGQSIGIDVGTALQHGSYVEFDTKPHFPPTKPIFQWVERTLNIVSMGVTFESGRALPTGKVKRQFKQKKGRDRNMQILAVTRAIQWHIFHYGTKGKRYMEKALRSLGLPFKVIFESTGATYEIDIAAYLQERIDKILKQSGMMN